MPAGEIGEALVDFAGRAPGLDLPVGAFAHPDEIHHLPGAQGVVDDVPTGADPVGADQAPHAFGQALHRDHAAPGHDPGEFRPVGAEQGLADFRMYAVRADECIAAHVARIGRELDAAPILRERTAAPAQTDGVGLLRAHRRREHREQIGAIDREIGISIALDRRRAKVEQFPSVAGAPQAHFLGCRLARQARQVITQPEFVEHAIAIGRQLQAGADLLEFVRLFVYLDVEAAPEQSECGSQAADAAAGDEDFFHAHLVDPGARDLHRFFPANDLGVDETRELHRAGAQGR